MLGDPVTEPSQAAVKVVQAVLNAHPIALQDILDQFGILPAASLDVDEDDEDYESRDDSDSLSPNATVEGDGLDTAESEGE